MTGSLRDAAKVFMRHQATLGPKVNGPVIDIQSGPKLCVIPLLAFARQSPTLPDDFLTDVDTIVADAPHVRAGKAVSLWLQAHVRGDGAVYLGTFDVPHEQGGALVVYGDVNTTEAQARQASLAYRRMAMMATADQTDISQLGSVASSPAPTPDGDLTS
jgi:ATP-dependent Clp protease adapter protein ClpS